MPGVENHTSRINPWACSGKKPDFSGNNTNQSKVTKVHLPPNNQRNQSFASELSVWPKRIKQMNVCWIAVASICLSLKVAQWLQLKIEGERPDIVVVLCHPDGWSESSNIFLNRLYKYFGGNSCTCRWSQRRDFYPESIWILFQVCSTHSCPVIIRYLFNHWAFLTQFSVFLAFYTSELYKLRQELLPEVLVNLPWAIPSFHG